MGIIDDPERKKRTFQSHSMPLEVMACNGIVQPMKDVRVWIFKFKKTYEPKNYKFRGNTLDYMNAIKKQDVKQEVFDLYDDYAHNRVDRREFMQRLSKYAVGGLTVSSLMGFLMPDYQGAIQ